MLSFAILLLASSVKSTPTCQDIQGAYQAQNCCDGLQESFTVPDMWCSSTTSTAAPYDCVLAKAKVDLISMANATVALATPFDGTDAYLFEQSFEVLKSLTGVSLDITKTNANINKPTDVLQWYRSDVVVDGAVSLPKLGITLAQLQAAYGSKLIDVVTKDGEPYAVPVVTQPKGVLFYNTDIVTSAPSSWDGLMQLLQTLQAQGHSKPLCMAGDDGWPLTDVLENIVAEDANSVYTPWAKGEVAFNDTAIKSAVTKVAALQPYVNLTYTWSGVLSNVNQKVLDGDCALTIMPHFGPGFSDADLVSDSKVKSAFIFNDYTVLGALFAVAKSSTDAVRQAMVWQSSPLLANSFVGLSDSNGRPGVLISPNINVDVNTYNSFTKPFAERVTNAIRSNTAVFDASDRMPSTLDNKLKQELLKLVNGRTTVDDALEVLECTRTDSCPKSDILWRWVDGTEPYKPFASQQFKDILLPLMRTQLDDTTYTPAVGALMTASEAAAADYAFKQAASSIEALDGVVVVKM